MNEATQRAFISQLEAVERVYAAIVAKAKYDDLSDVKPDDISHIVTVGTSAVERITGKNSTYMTEIRRSLEGKPANYYNNPKTIIGIVRGLKHDLAAGYLSTLSGMIYGEVFADMIGMAEHLLEEGYKDAAAVVVGGALEQHLRKLCRSNGIDVEADTREGKRPKKADLMNSELAAKNVIGKLDQKGVTAWLDLRNKAAHAQYGDYNRDQVALMVSGVREFISRTLG